MCSVSKLQGEPQRGSVHTASVVEHANFSDAFPFPLIDENPPFDAEHFDQIGTGLDRIVDQLCKRVSRVLVSAVAHRLYSERRRYDLAIV
jgi:hypothetical protein